MDLFVYKMSEKHNMQRFLSIQSGVVEYQSKNISTTAR